MHEQRAKEEARPAPPRIEQRRPGTLTLAIETSNPSASAPSLSAGSAFTPRPGIALGEWRDNAWTTLATRAIQAATPGHDDLMIAVDACVTAAGAAPRDIGAVAVSIGPGGFTAVRIAVTAAKFIAEATGAACIPIPSALIVAQRAPAAESPCVLLASKGESIWATWFAPRAEANQLPQLLAARLVTAKDFDPGDSTCLIADRFLPPSMRGLADERGLRIHEPIFDPVACLECSTFMQSTDPAALAPLYPREPEAVTKWRALHPPSK